MYVCKDVNVVITRQPWVSILTYTLFGTLSLMFTLHVPSCLTCKLLWWGWPVSAEKGTPSRPKIRKFIHTFPRLVLLSKTSKRPSSEELKLEGQGILPFAKAMANTEHFYFNQNFLYLSFCDVAILF